MILFQLVDELRHLCHRIVATQNIDDLPLNLVWLIVQNFDQWVIKAARNPIEIADDVL